MRAFGFNMFQKLSPAAALELGKKMLLKHKFKSTIRTTLLDTKFVEQETEDLDELIKRILLQ